MSVLFKIPHTLALLFFLMVLALIATWIIPQGEFETEITEIGREAVVPGTYKQSPEREILSPLLLFTAIPRAFRDAQDIIFFLFIIGGVMSIIRGTGSIDAILGWLLKKFGNKPSLLIFTVIFILALTSSSIGASGEYIPFVLILVALCRAMNLDAMTAVGIVIAGYGIGYGSAAFNPYTVVVAQGIAEIPTYSGWELRMIILIPFVIIGAHHVWRYSTRVLNDPGKSLLFDNNSSLISDPSKKYPHIEIRHLLIVGGFVTVLATTVWGIATQGWYLTELGAAFLILGLFAALIGRTGINTTASRFVTGATELTQTALLVGVARGIALVMEDGKILHTIVHGLSMPLQTVGPEVASVGMLVIQSILNLFIPSGSGQAFVTMPIMAPLGDIIGVTRQVSVLAYQFGDGFANMIVPTNAVLMGILGAAGVPFDRWFRFCLPLFLKLMVAASCILILAVLFGFS